MKKIYTVIAIIIILGIAFGIYSYFAATNEIVADDDLPGTPGNVKDAMESMTPEEKAEFDNAVEQSKNNITEMSDSMPQEIQVISQGLFKPRAHDVMGKALIIQQGENKILRFENFETINGPNLHIYLSSDLGTDDFIDLGEIKATKGNVNYEIPPGVDTDKYNKVLVWCVPFKVLFSYAEPEKSKAF